MDEKRKILIQNIFYSDIIVQGNPHLKRWLKSANNNLSNSFLQSLLLSEDSNEEITDRLNAIMHQQEIEQREMEKERERDREIERERDREIERERDREIEREYIPVVERKIINPMQRLIYNANKQKIKEKEKQEEIQNKFEVKKRKKELEDELSTKKRGSIYIEDDPYYISTLPTRTPSSKKKVSFNKMRKVKYIGGKRTRKSRKKSRKQSRRL